MVSFIFLSIPNSPRSPVVISGLGKLVSFVFIISMKGKLQITITNIIAIIILTIILICFVVFTYFPLKIEIFRDPVTSKYGITKNIE